MPSPDLRRQKGPHVFVTDLDAPDLGDHDRHHLERALRLRTGDALTISDADGNWRTARFDAMVEPTGPVHHIDAPKYDLTLGIALTKAAKPELAVQKATEIGIDHVVIFQSDNSVARWDQAKRDKNERRLTVVIREAAMQSRRVRIPTVRVCEDLGSLLGSSPVRADFDGPMLTEAHRVVLVGPEGGWSPQERDLIPNSVSLGPTVLRAETAAIVASSYMSRTRG